MLISIESKLATYHHMVVVWKEMVIDYEFIFTYPLTEDSLRQICGVLPLHGFAVGMASFHQSKLANYQRMGI
jgi:hypothetical protein